MILQNEYYTITIEIDQTYRVDSMDNVPYTLVFNPQCYTRGDLSKTFRIHIVGILEADIAFIGDFHSYAAKCALLQNHQLTILQNTTLIQLDLQLLHITRMHTFSTFGCYLALYPFGDGYLIHGELDILLLDQQLRQRWSFAGADIFVTQDGRPALEIKGEELYLLDWNGNRYHLNQEGILQGD